MSSQQQHPLLLRWQAIVAAQADSTAVWCPQGRSRHSFAELAERADALARTLPAALHGQTVALQTPDRLHWLIAFLALRQHHCTILPLEDSLSPGNRDRILCATQASAILDSNGIHPLPSPGNASGSPAPALLKLTSGSSGTPKAIPFSEEALIADADNLCPTMGISPADRNFATLPLGHSYALGNLVLPLLTRGIPLCLGTAGLSSALADELSWSGATVYPSVPAHWARLCQSTLENLGPLRLTITAAAPLSPALAQAFQQRFRLRLHNFYGASETGGIAYDRDGECGLSGTHIGTAVEGVTLALDHTRQLTITSHAISPALGETTPSGARRYTLADRADISASGLISLHGRSDRVIKHHGRRYDLEALEQTISRHLATAECALLYDASREHFALYLPPGLSASARNYLKHHDILPPRRTRLHEIPSLPRTPRGKIDLEKLSPCV